MISQSLSQSQTQVQPQCANSSAINRVPTIPSKRRASGPSSLFLSPSQIAKHVYNNDFVNNDDDIKSEEDILSQGRTNKDHVYVV